MIGCLIQKNEEQNGSIVQMMNMLVGIAAVRRKSISQSFPAACMSLLMGDWLAGTGRLLGMLEVPDASYSPSKLSV
jgi:hypothetical protein